MDNQHRSGRVYMKHRIDFQLMSDIKKAVEYLNKHLMTAIENGDRNEKEEPMEVSVMRPSYWVTIEKPLSIMKNI